MSGGPGNGRFATLILLKSSLFFLAKSYLSNKNVSSSGIFFQIFILRDKVCLLQTSNSQIHNILYVAVQTVMTCLFSYYRDGNRFGLGGFPIQIYPMPISKVSH